MASRLGLTVSDASALRQTLLSRNERNERRSVAAGDPYHAAMEGSKSV
jgi:hypothetical protein